MDPTDPATLYVLHGATWTVTVDRLRAGRTEPVALPDMGPRPQVFEWKAPMIFAVAPWDARTLFFGHNGTLFVSRDDAAHWTRVQVSGAVQHLALSRDPGVSYAAVVESQSGIVVSIAASQLLPRAAIGALAAQHGATVVGAGESIDAAPHARGLARVEPTLVQTVSIDSWEPAYGRLAEAQVKWDAAHGRSLATE